MKQTNHSWIFLALFLLTLYLYFAYGTSTITTDFGSFLDSFKENSTNVEKSPFAIFKREKTVYVPILMYHYVEYNDDKRDYLRDSLNIPPHIFEQQIITLKNAGYTVITPADLYNKKADKVKKPVILSFDDGYEDFYTDVFPLLEKHKVKAVSYLVVNFINEPNYMLEAQIKEISRSGLVEFGSHTMNHAWLPANSNENIDFELRQSKSYLEQLVKQDVTSFAYPYGAYDETVIRLTKSAGYTNAVTTDIGVSNVNKERYTIKRVRPGYNTGDDLLYILQK